MEQDLRNDFSIKISSPYWKDAYEKALQELGTPEWMTETYIRQLHEEYEIFPETLEIMIEAAEQISKNKELCILAKVLSNIVGLRTSAQLAFPVFELPEAPKNEERLAYDCVAAFPILAHIRSSWKELEERGIAEDVLKIRFSMLDQWLAASIKKVGRPFFGKDSFLLYRAFVYVSELKLGRLRFQWVEHSTYPVKGFVNNCGELLLMMDGINLHRSGHILGTYGFTDEEGSFLARVGDIEDGYEGYAVDEKTHLVQTFRTRLEKKEWRLVFAPGDAIIKVHIEPGPGFGAAECEESFGMARELFARCFPEYDFKGFLTHTWLLDPALDIVLKEGSNIKDFRTRFHIFPAQSNGTDVFRYVYQENVKSPDEVVINTLKEDTFLRKALKEQMKKGNFVYEFNGFFLW